MTEVFRYRPDSAKIRRSVVNLMEERRLGELSAKLKARALCRGFVHGRKGYDKSEEIKLTIYGAGQLMEGMKDLAAQMSLSHFRHAGTCELKPIITITASIEGLESFSFQLIDPHRHSEF